jgi:signal transduction histidine kinase
MTLRRRLVLSVTALVVIAIGLSVVLVGSRNDRRATLDLFAASYDRTHHLSELEQCIAEHHRQLTLLAQTFDGGIGSGVGIDAEVRSAFRSRLDHCRHLAETVSGDEAGIPSNPHLDALAADVGRLFDAWLFVIDNLGARHVEAISHQALVADPLAEKLMKTDVPDAERQQAESLAAASQAFGTSSDRADATVVSALLVMLVTVAVVAAGFLRRLLIGLGALERGMERYGRGELEHRVVIGGNDEIASVATQINAMAERLAANRVELERRTDDLQRTVDELRTTQAALVQQEKMAALGGLVAGVAHEVNTPLGVAVTTASLIQEHVNELRAHAEAGTATRGILRRNVGGLEEGTRLLLENLRRAATLIQSFKQVAVDRGEVSTRSVELTDWMQSVVQSLSPVTRRHGVRVETSVPEGLRVVLAVGELEQVLTNLLVNACVHGFPEDLEYAPATDTRRVTVAVHPLAAHLAVEVVDNGVGMHADVAARVFEPFFTTRRGRGGTGLGMHIVHQLVVERFRGQIAVRSAPSEGTRWTIMLPFPTDALRPAHAEGAP